VSDFVRRYRLSHDAAVTLNDLRNHHLARIFSDRVLELFFSPLMNRRSLDSRCRIGDQRSCGPAGDLIR
jgi:hypothetical protein